jgi:hypothetical protein
MIDQGGKFLRVLYAILSLRIVPCTISLFVESVTL